MYNRRFFKYYKTCYSLAVLCSVALLLELFFDFPWKRGYEDEMAVLFVLFAAMAGVFGFFSGEKFVLLGRPSLYLPKAGRDEDDEQRAWGLTYAIFYLCILLVAFALHDS